MIEVDERIAADGTVLRAPDLEALAGPLQAAYDSGFRAVAVVCMHSHLHSAHEQAVGELAERIGFPQISLSSEVSPLMKLVPRATRPSSTPTCRPCCAATSSTSPMNSRACG